MISVKLEGFFEEEKTERRPGLRVDSTKARGFFAKRPRLARSGPSARPIERPRKARDVARWLAAVWTQVSYIQMLAGDNGQVPVYSSMLVGDNSQ